MADVRCQMSDGGGKIADCGLMIEDYGECRIKGGEVSLTEAGGKNVAVSCLLLVGTGACKCG